MGKLSFSYIEGQLTIYRDSKLMFQIDGESVIFSDNFRKNRSSWLPKIMTYSEHSDIPPLVQDTGPLWCAPSLSLEDAMMEYRRRLIP